MIAKVLLNEMILAETLATYWNVVGKSPAALILSPRAAVRFAQSNRGMRDILGVPLVPHPKCPTEIVYAVDADDLAKALADNFWQPSQSASQSQARQS